MADGNNAMQLVVAASTDGAQAALVQFGNVTEKQLQRAVREFQNVQKAVRDNERSMAQAAATSTKAANDEVDAAHKVAGGHAGVTRELLVLGHEMSQGNYKKFGGSMLVLAERMDLLKYATNPAALALIAAGAAVAVTGGLMVKGSIDADAFAKSLMLTGNAAGLTLGSFNSMARGLADSTRSTIGASKEVIEELAASGRFYSGNMADAARVAVLLEQASGKTAQEVVGDMAKMADGATKWAEEHNKAWHFISAAQLAHVKQLEETGHAEEAQKEVLDAVGAHVAGAAKQVEALAGWWDRVKKGASDAIDTMKRVGEGGTLDKAIAEQQKLVGGLQNAVNGTAVAPFGRFYFSDQSMRDDLAAQKAFLDRLMQSKKLQEDVAKAQSDSDRRQAAGIDARSSVDGLLKRAHAQDALTEALKKYHAEVKAAADAGAPYSAGDIAAGEAQIRRDYKPHVDAGANEYQRLMETVKAYNAVSAQETAGTVALNEAQRWAIEQHKVLADVSKNLTQKQREAAGAAIDQAAATRATVDGEIEARKAWIAEMKADDHAQREQTQGVIDFLSTADAQIAKIHAETSEIGMSATARQQLVEQMALEAEYRKKLADGADPADALAAYTQEMEALTVAQEQRTKAQNDWNSSFSNGAAKAMQTYADAAKNSAAQAEQFMTNSMKSIEDAIVNTVMTGKTNFKSLADSIIADLVRIQARQAISGAGSYAGMFSSGGYWGGGSSSSGLFAGTGTYANGIDYVPYDGFPAVLHEGEKVTSRQDVRRGGDGTVIHMGDMHITVGAGVSMQQVNMAVAQGQAESERRTKRLVSQGRL
jgi:lambda family phage tail tape measure protein